MTGLSLADVRLILDAVVLTGEVLLDRTISHITATDMMSRVLAESPPGTLLLTCLNNIQVVNTAAVTGLAGVVFVADNHPRAEVVAKATDNGIPLLVAPQSMYVACGLLHSRTAPGTGT